LLAATHMPVYDTAARELPREVAAEADSPSGRRKPRAGRRQAAGKAAPLAAESPAAESSVADEAAPPVEAPLAGDATVVADATMAEVPVDAAAAPTATDISDLGPEPSSGAPEGGHDGEQAATPADEPVDT
jgi:hypothetical protein